MNPPSLTPENRSYHGHLVCLAVLMILTSGICIRPALAVQGPTRPNLLFLLTDDQRWDTTGCMGNSIIQTPQMDALARDGVVFDNMFVTTSICCSSRASILSGQYLSRHGIRDFAKPFSPAALAETYPQQLRAAGYRVGFIGKYGVGGSAPPPTNQFDYWWAVTGQPNYENKAPDGTIRHYTDLVREHSREFLESGKANQPFCLSISYKSPHVQDGDPRQFIYHPRYRDLYRDVVIPRPKTGGDEFFHLLPTCLANENNEGRARWQIRFSTPEKYQEMVKGYYRLITGVDDAIAQLREDLRRLGLDQNTVIILTGDNGFYLGEHGLAGKWYGHEESIRVPLVVYDPRLPKSQRGRHRQEMVLNIDLAPTLLDLAGVPVPKSMQGRSLTPFFRGKYRFFWRDEFFYEHRLPYDRIPESEGVVGSRYKYLRYLNREPIEEELYDLEHDPHEINNLALDPKQTRLLSRMRERCDQWKTKAQ